MKKILFSAAFLAFAMTATAQKVNEAQSILDNVNTLKAKIDAETKKSVLRQAYDTLGLFNANLSVLQEVSKANALISSYPEDVKQIADKNEQKAVKALRKSITGYINDAYQARRDLLVGAYQFLVADSHINEVVGYIDGYIDRTGDPMFASRNLEQTDTLLATAGYYGLFAINKAQCEGKEDKTIKFATYAARDPQNEEKALSDMVFAYKTKGDTDKMLEVIGQAIEKYPKQDWFVRQAIDYYINNKKENEGIAFLDGLIAKDPQSFIGYYLKGCMLFNMEKYEESVAMFDKAIEINPTEGGTYVDAGQAVLNQVQKYLDSNIKLTFKDPKAAALMSKAEGYFLKLKEMKPEDPSKWSMFLYRIYYNIYGENDARTKEMQTLCGM